MSRRTVLGALAVSACFAAALVLVLLAADVVRVREAIDSGDARFATAAGVRGMWSADTALPDGMAKGMLEADDDLAFRSAVQRFRLVRPREPVTQFSQLTVRSGVERELAKAARDDDDPVRRAALSNLRGALAVEESRLGAGSAPPLRRAVTHFRRAVELDPTNPDAIYNLELVLRLLSRSGSSSAGSGERAATPASGAGSASAGSGY